MKRSVCIVLIWTVFSFGKTVFGQHKLDEYFEHLLYHRKFMGSAAISFNDSIIYTKSVGFADAGTEKPITSDTRFRIGSITKTFTAVLILQAIEEKKLTLDDKLGTYYPAVKNAMTITIEQLLKHRSGIVNFTEIDSTYKWEEEYHNQEAFLAYISNRKSDFAPGSAYAYSNTNYALLAFILEKVYQLPFALILEKKICQPLGLKNTYYSFETDTAKNEAISYNIQDRYTRNSKVNFSNHPGGGGMVSTAVEVNIFLSALFNGKLITTQSLETMLPVNKGEYGMGIEKLSFSSPNGYEHTGRIENYISDYWYFPKEKLGIVTLSNAINSNISEINLVLLQYAYGTKPVLPDYNKINGVADTVFSKIKGTYFDTSGKISVTLSSDSRQLILQKSTTRQDYIPFDYKEHNIFVYENIILRFFPERKEVVLEQNGITEVYKKEWQQPSATSRVTGRLKFSYLFQSL